MIEYNFECKQKHNNFVVETFNKFSKNKITHIVKTEKNTEYYDFVNQHFYCQYENSSLLTNDYDFIFMSSKNQKSKIIHMLNIFMIDMKTFDNNNNCYREYKITVEFKDIPTFSEMLDIIKKRKIESFSEDDIDLTFQRLIWSNIDLSFMNNFGNYFFIDYIDMTNEEYEKNKSSFEFKNKYEIKRELIKPDNFNFDYSYILPFLELLSLNRK